MDSQYVERLDAWRQDAGLGHNAFARLLGISHSYWTLLRTGKRQPSRSLVTVTLAKAPEPWRAELAQAHVSDISPAAAVA